MAERMSSGPSGPQLLTLTLMSSQTFPERVVGAQIPRPRMYYRAVDRILDSSYSPQQCSILFPRLRKEVPVGFRSHSAVPFAAGAAPAFLAGP